LRNEFTATPGSPAIDVVLADSFMPAYLATKGEYIRYWIEDSPIESVIPDGEVRNYIIGLYYYFDTGKKQIQRDWETLFSDRVEHIKKLIRNNHSYSPTSGYTWHWASVENVSELMMVNESDDIEVAGFENVRVIKLTIKIIRGNFS
jgi:hypothetical protein